MVLDLEFLSLSGVDHSLQKKKLGSVSEKDENFCEPENHRLRRLHGLGPSANNKRKERTEERSLPKKTDFVSLLPSLRGNSHAHACHYKPVLVRRQGGDDFF